LDPLKPQQVPTLEEWLEKASYPEARKKELKKLYDKSLQEGFLFFDQKGFPSRSSYCKCFVKDEGYPTYKFARGIFSRTDFFKVFCAPYFKAIEEVIFKRKEFIKKVPVLSRPQYILDNFLLNASLGDDLEMHTLNTDYSSYECSFSKEMMESCEEVLYRYMLQDIPDSAQKLDIMMKVLKGTNVLKFRNVTAKVKARRMSGEMNTSLGNGFANLMIYLYLCELHGCENMFCLVEGDDLLAQYKGRLFTIADYAEFGLIVKTVYVVNPNTASFCGQLFDLDSKIVIADPIKVLLNFGWSDLSALGARHPKRMALLRAKAYSYAYQYFQCPIIYPLAQLFLRLTSGFKVAVLKDTWRNMMSVFGQERDLTISCIPSSARLFMQTQFGIKIQDQLAFENYLDSLTVVQPLQHESMESYIPLVTRQFDDRYVKTVDLFCAFRSNLQF